MGRTRRTTARKALRISGRELGMLARVRSGNGEEGAVTCGGVGCVHRDGRNQSLSHVE